MCLVKGERERQNICCGGSLARVNKDRTSERRRKWGNRTSQGTAGKPWTPQESPKLMDYDREGVVTRNTVHPIMAEGFKPSTLNRARLPDPRPGFRILGGKFQSHSYIPAPRKGPTNVNFEDA